MYQPKRQDQLRQMCFNRHLVLAELEKRLEQATEKNDLETADLIIRRQCQIMDELDQLGEVAEA